MVFSTSKIELMITNQTQLNNLGVITATWEKNLLLYVFQDVNICSRFFLHYQISL
jgi:hypothetical protein